MGLIDEDGMSGLVSRLFLWDCLEKRGTPITDDIRVIDIDGLSHDERLIISGGDPVEIQKLVELYGDTLESQLTLSVRVFTKLVNNLYEHASNEQKVEMTKLIRSTIDKFTKGEDQ